eukprot:12430220-Karenia_brevis.AAC.1
MFPYKTTIPLGAQICMQDFSLLRYMGATQLKPCFADEYLRPECWGILQERWNLLPVGEATKLAGRQDYA